VNKKNRAAGRQTTLLVLVPSRFNTARSGAKVFSFRGRNAFFNKELLDFTGRSIFYGFGRTQS
jgi:hypothetical protein